MKQRLKDWHVTLKMHASPNGGTRIFKESVRFVFGKKELRDDEIEAMKALQDSYYRCKFGRQEGEEEDATVSFWISLETLEARKKQDEWANNVEDVRYLRIKNRDVGFVRASDECLRDEIRKNGGKSLEERRKRRKPTQPVEELALPQNKKLSLGEAKEVKRSALKAGKEWTEELKERALTVAEEWVGESADWTQSFIKRSMAEKLDQDLATWLDSQRGSLCNSKPYADDYDRFREEVMETIVVDGVNRMGNAMVEWFDNQTRGSSLGFGTSRPSASLVDIRDPFGLGSTNSLRGSDFEPIGWDTSSTQSLSRLDSESILSGFGSELDDSTSVTIMMNCDDSTSFSFQEERQRHLASTTRGRPHEVTGNPPPPDCVVIRANRDKGRPTPPVSTRKGASSARRSASEKAHQSIHDTKGEVTGTVGDSGTEKVYVSYSKAEGPGRRTAQTEDGSPKGGGWCDNSKERTWVVDDDSPADDNGGDPLSILSKGGNLGSGGDNEEPAWAASGVSPASNGGDRLSIRSKGRASFRKKWMRTIAEG
ncbi:expressed unknown protein [Seminavis robusta]|uniref:Uncharacterized protein n=1 Tax=Seminavis robusta TaxID=568900 RepID=A0A9N8HX33_9STRA|nr:expressed unknown protein [Seminavis robusta]|eukprot:Sro2903_g339870.1 n/a (539) ;mRNA; r:568-2277